MPVARLSCLLQRPSACFFHPPSLDRCKGNMALLSASSRIQCGPSSSCRPRCVSAFKPALPSKFITRSLPSNNVDAASSTPVQPSEAVVVDRRSALAMQASLMLSLVVGGSGLSFPLPAAAAFTQAPPGYRVQVGAAVCSNSWVCDWEGTHTLASRMTHTSTHFIIWHAAGSPSSVHGPLLNCFIVTPSTCLQQASYNKMCNPPHLHMLAADSLACCRSITITIIAWLITYIAAAGRPH